jgi:hypothetical protein
MGNRPTVEVYVTSTDVGSGDVVGFFCGHGNQGRLRSKPVPNLKVPGFKKKDILRDKDLRKFEEIDNHALNVRNLTLSVKLLKVRNTHTLNVKDNLALDIGPHDEC